MAKEICISTTPHETRLAILEDDQLAEVYYERENEYTLAGSVYKGRVTRVLPGMQSSFVDVGLERDAFLYVTDFLEEQEDSEDYETSAPTGGGQGGRRSERSTGIAEEQESAGSAAAGDERRGRRDSRRGSGERSGERSGRGGERGSERVGERAEVAPEQPQGRRGAAAEERAAATAALKSAQPAETDRAEKGDDEDSPQGTRRWRGRRGRRRGGMRAGVLGAGAATVAVVESGVLDDSAAQTAAAPFSMPEHGAPGGLAAPLPEAVSQSRQDEQAGQDSQNDRSAQNNQRDQASVNLQAAAAVQPLAREHSPASSSTAGDRSRQGRGDRSSGRGDRAERSAHSTRGDGAVAANAAFLPGESLSKYGGVASNTAAPKQEAKFSLPSKPVNYVAPRPSTLVEVPGGWDGGAVLPGESLSRYQGQVSDHALAREEAMGLDQIAAETSPDAFAQSAEDFTTESVTMDAVSSASAHTDSALEAAPQALFPSEREESIQSALNAAAPSGAPLPETVAEALPTAEHAAQQTTSAEPLLNGELGNEQTRRAIAESSEGIDVAPLLGEEEQEPSEAALSEQALTAPHLLPGTDPIIGSPSSDAVASERKADKPEAADYDPEGQSASVRVAPPTTSELRFSQLFGGGDREAAAKLPNFEEAKQESAESSSKAELPNRATLDAGSDGLQSQGAERTENPSHADRLEEALAPTFGNRFADEPFADSLHEHSHEHSVDEHQEDERLKDEQGDQLETEQLPEDAPLPLHLHSVEAAGSGDHFKELVDQLQGFAPGAGLLEEEVIDEEEYDFDPIHAHADEQDLEDLEEETLDGDEELQPFAAMEGTEPAHDSASSTQLPREAVDAFEGEEEDDEPASLLLEEMSEAEEDEEAAPASTNGDAQRRERGTGDERRGRGGRNGKRRGIGGSSNGGGRRQSAQTQDLPIISDLLKQGQEILVQIAKEPIAKKGARITSHIALPGRFLVFMPTVSHVGVSRKIASDEERQRLKRVLISERGDAQGGFIVRTAAEGASEEELRADLRFLISLWIEIKQRAETAKAPALIYHVERILRDQVSSNFSTIWVDTEQEYERIVRFLNRFQPALVRRVKLYTKETPLFEHFGIQEEISKALKSKVWLKSGGSIVINQTEALVAIDINTGKYVGKTARLEDTIVKTNLDAIPEIVRQIRLRDLGGIIVIDFIDMDERKNRHRVLAALEEAMKADRAPSKVLQFNDFGLVAITRKRVKQSLERTLSVTCETCAGTGMVKSPITVCNEIYIELRKMQKHLDGKDVLLRVNPEVVKQLKGGNGRWINEYEELVGKTIIIKSDPALHPEQFDIH